MIFYIHGYGSGIKKEKVLELSKIFSQEVIGLQYDSAKGYKENFDFLLYDIVNFYDGSKEDIVIIGTSLGAFYANNLSNALANSRCILTNPALEPYDGLKKYIGVHKNYVTGVEYIFTEEVLETYNIKLKINNSSLILLSSGDKVIDSFKTQKQFEKQTNVIMYNGGEHRFKHYEEAQIDMLRFIDS